MFLVSWISAWMISSGYPRLANAVVPLLWVLAAILLALFVWWRIGLWREDIYVRARLEITSELKVAHDARLRELTAEVKRFGEDSLARADALDKGQTAFATATATTLAQLKNKPIIVKNEQGECRRVSPEAAKT